MIDFPIIDAHIHLWDLNLIGYPWLTNVPEINNTYVVSDYDEARGKQEVEAMVFVQCECNHHQYLDELAWVQSIADKESRLKAIVPWAPLENGDFIEDTLYKMAKDPRVKGIRRIIEFEEDSDFCVQPGFIRGVQLLGEVGLHFELTIAPSNFQNVMKLVEACPNTRFILDHVGSPDIANGKFQPWHDDLKLFAQSGPHFCKFSNLVCNADLNNWKLNNLLKYI